MKIIYNKIIPFRGYIAINICGIMFARKEYEPVGKSTIQHEEIHTAQMKELWYIGFYILYLLEWIYRLIFHTKTAYRGISFEQEAYKNQWRKNYLKYRKPYAWCGYWKNKEKSK